MLKGIAHTGGDDPSEDRYGVVVALSQLSQTLTDAEADSAFLAAAETAAALLRVPATVVFLRRSSDLAVGGSTGVGAGQALVEAAEETARASLASCAPVIYPNVSSESSPAAKKLANAGVASVVCVPMRVGQTNVGAIVAASLSPRSFSPSDVELLHVVASHAALAAWRLNTSSFRPDGKLDDHSDLIRLAERKIQELSLLNQVSDAVGSTLDLEKLLDIALEQSLAAVGADAGSLMLVSEETGRLEIVASRGIAARLVETTSQEVGKSIAGWVAEHGESVLVTDAHEDARFRMSFFRESITSSASVPLKMKGRVIGVLNVNTVQAKTVFDERDLELLGTVANQMAVAIENARLYARVNRRTKQLDSLLQISKTITSTLNLDEVLRRLSGEICKLFQLDVCVLLLLDELSGRLRLAHGAGLKTRRKYVYYDLAAPMAARVKKAGKKLVLRDIGASPALRTDASKAEGLRAAICMPLKNQGKLIGIAAGFARDARTFPKSQVDIIRSLGDLAGVAIHNARVYRRKYRIAEMLQQRLVPSSIPQIQGIDIGHRFSPAREVGGDYYDFIRAGSNRIGVVMADVSGSDVEAAEYTTMGKHVLRTYARECPSPAEVLMKTNDLVCEDTLAEVFISLFYGVIDLDRMRLTYANAGCEPPVLYKAADSSIAALNTDGILLGIRSGSTFEERSIDLEPGDVITLYTDGLTEASVDGRRLGAHAVMETIAANVHLGAQEIADRVNDMLLEYVHGRISDDVAMVVLKVS